MVLLDIGANPDSTAENLAQFARMGAIFAERVMGIPRPRVALLSIGEERGKGDARIQRATELLDASDLRFEGNIEGKDLTKHRADVVVCDAVLGNVVIKFFEGLSGFIFDLWRTEFTRGLRGRLGAVFMKPGIDRIRGVFDYEKVGGSTLLGVARDRDHHPRPGASRMIDFACDVAATTARTRVPALIGEALPRMRPPARPRDRRGRRETPPRPPRGSPRERPRADRRPVGDPRARRAGGARGARASPGSGAAAPPGGGCSAAARCASASSRTG